MVAGGHRGLQEQAGRRKAGDQLARGHLPGLESREILTPAPSQLPYGSVNSFLTSQKD